MSCPVRFEFVLRFQLIVGLTQNFRRLILDLRTAVGPAPDRRGLIEREAAQAMLAWAHALGFSLDASVRVEADDRPGLERLLRYCARPAFALERLRESDPEHLVYESVKPGPGGGVTLMLTPLELVDRLAALIRPPRRHRHRYFGVLAPNAPLRSAVTALEGTAVQTPVVPAPARPPNLPSASAEVAEEPIHRRAARYAWALLLARIYEVFPGLCPKCGAQMQIIAFITEAVSLRQILAHLGEPTSPPRMAPARGPPLWEMPDAEHSPFDPHAQPAPDYEFDQRIAW
ncbi:MAG: transposase [Candidatus Methylophosphatis roskildensis]